MLFGPLGEPLITKIFIKYSQLSTEIVENAYIEVKVMVDEIY